MYREYLGMKHVLFYATQTEKRIVSMLNSMEQRSLHIPNSKIYFDHKLTEIPCLMCLFESTGKKGNHVKNLILGMVILIIGKWQAQCDVFYYYFQLAFNSKSCGHAGAPPANAYTIIYNRIGTINEEI